MTDERRARFDALFAAYSPDMVAYCGWRAASPADAQDAVSEVFLTAWRRLDDVPAGDAARVWLYATARRVIANQRRAGRRRDALRERLALVALLVVDGTVYGSDPRHGWVAQGSPRNIDPDSGTTPAETLAAVRADGGGDTLRRIAAAMTGLTSSQRGDGSTVYTGTVPAGVIARETGIKDGERIRVLPFGIVANDEAAHADAPLRTAVTVGQDGIVRAIAATWGSWSYTVTYSGLGSTPAPTAPKHAVPLLELRGFPR